MRKKKNILIVSRSFYPMQSPRSYRTTELVKEFARQGHEVTLLTLKDDDHHISFEEEFDVTIKDFGPLKLPKVKPNGKGGLLHRLKWMSQRICEILFEYPDIELVYRIKNALKNETGYDLMISIAVPHPIHWGVAWARNETHPIADTWAADCGDPYMGFDIDRISKPFYFKYVEKMFCRKADYITVPIEDAKDAYYSEFRNKIKVIPQGFKFDEVDIEQTPPNTNGIPVFGYAGNLLGGGRNPHELLEYLVNLDKNFKFIIYTEHEGPVVPYMDKAGDRIEIRNYVPRKQLLKDLSGMNFLVNLENDTDTQLPSKLIDYYLAGRPVLSVPSSGLNSEKIQHFLEGDYSNQYQYHNMDRYRIENVCKAFLDLRNKKVGTR